VITVAATSGAATGYARLQLTSTAVVAPPAVATGDVGGTVPATLALSLAPSTGFGAFIPGLAGDYSATLAADVVSTAGDASLSVSDPSPSAPGHLVNNAFALNQPLAAKASSPAGVGTAFAAIGSDPVTLLRYAAPASHDPVTVAFRQSIAANDALRTGTYAKTLTFTLSTTTP
jgi:hypothetical protein